MKDYSFVLVGHGGCHNRGCEAIIRTTLSLLTSVIDKASFVVLSGNPEYDNKLNPSIDSAIIVNSIPNRFDPILIPRKIANRAFRLIRVSNVFQWQNEVFYLKKYFNKCDMVISVGGDNYTEDYGDPEYFIQALEFAKLMGKKTVIWSASIGPFQNNTLKERMQKFLHQVDLITVRESMTLEYLKSIGISKNVRLVADPAFILEPLKTERIDEMIASCSRPLLGINVSRLVAPEETESQFISSFVSFINQFISESKGHVIFIPHDIKYNNQKNSDHSIIQKIYEKVYSEKAIIAPLDMNALETKYLISRCDYFIGAKTHSTIAALSSYVPTISIAYSTKAYGINSDLFGHNNYVISYDNISFEALWKSYESLTENSAVIRDFLKTKIPEIQQHATDGAKYISELISRDANAR